jgi:3D (Asp-Asp-Asp) domain-containing protein
MNKIIHETKTKEGIMDSWIMPMLRILTVFVIGFYICAWICVIGAWYQEREAIKMEVPEHTKIIIVNIKVLEKAKNFTLISGATITAYNSKVEQTDSTPNITANGEKAGPKSIACPRRFAFGTKIEYAGKEYRCNDRMNLRYDCSFGNKCVEERWDIWMESEKEANEFGKRTNQTIKIIL